MGETQSGHKVVTTMTDTNKKRLVWEIADHSDVGFERGTVEDIARAVDAMPAGMLDTLVMLAGLDTLPAHPGDAYASIEDMCE